MLTTFFNFYKTRNHLLGVICLLMFLFGQAAGNAQIPPYSMKIIDAPWAPSNSTIVTGIQGTSIVGYYSDTNGVSRGFLYTGSNWVNLNNIIPDGVYTSKIIGELISSNSSTQEIIYDKGKYTIFNPILPGGTKNGSTAINGISGAYLVGSYIDLKNNIQGFVFNGKKYIQLDNTLTKFFIPPNTSIQTGTSIPTAVDAIHAANVVGYFYNTMNPKGSVSGFLNQGTNWTTLDCPLGSHTIPTGVSGSNIVGTYTDLDKVTTRGFLFDGSTWTSIDDLLGDTSLGTYPTGVDGPNIVGTYTDTNSLVHSFELTPLRLGSGSLSEQSISLNNLLPMSVSYGITPLLLSATASSGLPVKYVSSNTRVATISTSNSLSIVGVGVTRITFSQAGDRSVYAAAPSIQQDLTVSKGSQTISYTTPLPSTIVFVKKGQKITLSATCTSRLPVTFKGNKASVISVSGKTATIQGTGTVTLTASQDGNANWNPAQTLSNSITVQ